MSNTVRLTGNERLRQNNEDVETKSEKSEQSAATRSAAPIAVQDGVDRPVTTSASTAATTSTSVAATAVTWNSQTSTAAATFASNTHVALNDSLSGSSEDLTAAFMKLNVLDPNDTVQTQMSLIAAQGELARLAVEQAKAAMRSAQKDKAEAGGRDLLAKSLLAIDPGLVKLQETLVKKGWMSDDYVAYHIKFAREQEAQSKGDSAEATTAMESARAQFDAAIAMLKDCNKRMQALLAQQAEEGREATRMDGASINGVPTARVQPAVSNAMSRIYSQLAAIQTNEGALGVLSQVEDVARTEFTAALKDAGMEHPEALVDFLVANVIMDVSAAQLGSGDTTIAAGAAISDLGSAYEGDSGNSQSLAAADIAALTQGDVRGVQDRQQAERLRS